jgi:DNA-binding NarL/FixJ family response regulator
MNAPTTLTLTDLTPRQREIADIYRQGFSAKIVNPYGVGLPVRGDD